MGVMACMVVRLQGVQWDSWLLLLAAGAEGHVKVVVMGLISRWKWLEWQGQGRRREKET